MSRVYYMAAALAVLSGCSVETGDFTSVLGDKVFLRDNGVIEVAKRPGSANHEGWDYWCGAADYARRAKGADWDTPVYVYRGYGEGPEGVVGQTVQFTLDKASLSQPPSVMQRDEIGAFKIGHFMTVKDGTGICSRWLDRA